MTVTPSHVEINNTPFAVREWREYTEPAILRQAELIGVSRPSKTARPEILTYVMDDWSGGEGQKFLDTSFSDTDLMYFKTDGPVNVGEPGQLELGLATTEETGMGTMNVSNERGPWLGVLAGDLWIIWQDSSSGDVEARELTTLPSTWTSRDTGVFTGGQLQGPPGVLGKYWYVAGGWGVLRQHSGGNATSTTTTGRLALPADNRLYLGRTTTDLFDLQRQNLETTSGTPTSVYTARGVENGAGLVGVGNVVWSLTADTTEPRLHLFDGDVGVEKYPLPKGFRVALNDTTTLSRRPLSVMNNIVFVGGWIIGDGTTVAPHVPCLVYATSDAPGVLALIRSDSSDKITTLNATAANELLMGTQAGLIYRYDLETNSISEYIKLSTPASVMDITYNNGVYYISTVDGSNVGHLWRTTTSGSGIYPSSVTLRQSIWDFGYAQEEKILLEAEVITEELATGESVELSFVLDNDTAGIITTDVNGTTMSHATVGETRSVFQLSGLKTADSTIVNRACRYVEPRVTLKSGGGSTPTVYSVILRATGGEHVRLYDVTLDVTDGSPQSRFKVSGQKQADALRTMRDASPRSLVKVEPHYEKRAAPAPATGGSAFAAFLEAVDIQLTRQGSGTARILLRETES